MSQGFLRQIVFHDMIEIFVVPPRQLHVVQPAALLINAVRV